MMVKQPWEMGVGERTGTQPDGDTLLTRARDNSAAKRIKREEELEDKEHDAKMAELDKKKATAESAVEKTGEKKEESSGFKVTGGVDIGNINVQEERERAIAAAEKLRQESVDNANRTALENSQLRSDLHKAEMREMKAENAAALEVIANKIDNRSPVEIMDDIRASAASLGLTAPDPQAKDPMVAVKLMEMEHTESARQREFEWKMKQDEWAREDRKEERKDQRDYNLAKLAADEKKSDFWKTLPTTLTQALGQGIAATEEEEAAPVSSRKKQRGEMTAPMGATGKTECPSCKTEVGIGPTARQAVCTNCGTEITIHRVKEKTPSAAPINGSERAAEAEEDEE